jgi:hypothetical protein
MVCPIDMTVAVFNNAREPKRLELFSGGHFSACTDKLATAASPEPWQVGTRVLPGAPHSGWSAS